MALQIVLTVLFAVSALLKAGELTVRRRERTSAALLAASFAALAAGLALSFPGPLAAVDDVLPGLGRIVYNGLTFTGLYLLLVFFLRALRGASAAPRIRWEAGLLVAVVAALAVLVLVATPGTEREHSLSSPYLGEPPVAAFYLIGGAYFVHAYVAVARLIGSYVRAGGGPLAWALRLIAVGLAGLVVTSLVRIGRVVVAALDGPPLPALNTVNYQLNLLCHLILSVGLVVAGWAQALAVVRARRLRRRQHDALEPLWCVLTGMYPEIVLPPGRRRWLPDRSDRRLYRRVLECRDGLLRSGPMIAAAAGTTDLGALAPERIAGHLRELAAGGTHRAGPDPADPVAVATPAGTDVGGDVDALVAISDALPAVARP